MVKCKILDERLWVKTQENKTEGSELNIKIALFFSTTSAPMKPSSFKWKL